ncbi:MAG: lipid A Kdo2 1-phosphate O-methyltransferase, partial [Candidatus Tectomicrobia bacterium]|nr:lipid A Kdo2 1-phosphate O-methyltransferase [Candidatus Tectomicrobia bacterium]
MLSQALVRQGEFLFRWRGYLPLMLAPLVIYGLKDFQYYRDSHLYDILLEVACFAVAFTGLTIRFLV